MHAEDLILNCASIIKWKFATSTSEGTNGKHLLYLHDDSESSKRGYIVRLNSFCSFPSGSISLAVYKVCMHLKTRLSYN